MNNITVITWPKGQRSLMAHLLRICLGKVWQDAYAKGQALIADTTSARQEDAASDDTSTKGASKRPQIAGRSYLVEYEDFPHTVVAHFEEFVANGGEDSVPSFRNFASQEFSRYEAFTARWVKSDFAKTQVVVPVAELRANSKEWVLWAIDVLLPDQKPLAPAVLARVEKAAEDWIAANPAPDLTRFRHYDPALFQQLGKLNLRREVVQEVFREVMVRDLEEHNILPFQAELDRQALRDRLMKSAENRMQLCEGTGAISDQLNDLPGASLSVAEIQLAYQLFLGRAASENESANMLKSCKDTVALRRTFLTSKEFALSYKRLLGKSDKTKQPTVIHIHVPKTAGTSLNSLLEASFPKPQILNGVGGPPTVKLAELAQKDREALRLITGHAPYGIHKLLERPHLYLCLLRQPGPRLLSFYKYILRTKIHPLHNVMTSKEMSFGDFLEFVNSHPGDRIEFDNGQLRRLAGNMTLKSLGDETNLLPQALSHLFADDMLFGLSEDFDAYLVRLAARGVLVHSQSRHDNESPVTGSFDDAIAALTDHQRAILERFTFWDQKLYNAASEHLLSIQSRSGDVK